MNIQGKFFKTTDDKNIYFEEYGSGEPIVFIPGYLCTTRYLSRNIDALSENNHLIVMDSRSFGYSTKSQENLTIHRMAADIKELIEHLNLENVVLIGWSMGGNIAMAYYEQFGAYRLKSIALLDSTLFPYGVEEHNAHSLHNYNLEAFADLMKGAFANYEQYCKNFARSMFKNPISEDDEAWIVCDALKCPVHCAFALYENFVHLDFEKILPLIEIPTFICGAASPRTPKGLQMARHYKSLLKAPCTHYEFMDAGHILFYECPEEFNKVILEFIKQYEQSDFKAVKEQYS